MELTLTPRLATVAAQVAPGSRFADIGTDHAYLPVRLLLDGVIPSAIAADLREGPLARARETAERFGVTDKVSFRLCDGLTGLAPGEADTVAIAGMGGETIAAILAAAPWTKEGVHLLLQPMTSFPDLRRWLMENGYTIHGETVAREGGRYYTVLSVRGGEMPPMTAAELWVGRQSDDPLRRDYLDHMAAKVRRALDGQRASQSPDVGAVRALEEVLGGIETMREEL